MKNSLRNKLVSLYDDQDAYVKFYANMRSRLLKLDYYLELLPDNGLIIDVGCGYGVLANYLSLCCPNNSILGIDLDSKRINVAVRTIGKRKNISFEAVDATQWDWPSCSGITMTDFLHHVPASIHEKVLNAAIHSLENDGILLIAEVDPDAKPFYRYWTSYMSDRILYPLSKSYFRHYWSWQDILSKLGFDVEIIRWRRLFFAGTLFVCRKK